MKLKQKLYDLKNQMREALDRKKALIEKGELNTDAFKQQQTAIDTLKGQITEVEKAIAEEELLGGEDGMGGGTEPAGVKKAFSGASGGDSEAMAMKALADAARQGFCVKGMTEGSNPDGGYTVPQDIVTRVEKFRESRESLKSLIRITPVTTSSGRRTYQKRAGHTGLQEVAEGGAGVQVASPQFSIMEYSIKKKFGYLPVTNELLADSDENITQAVVEWLGDESRVGWNKGILKCIKDNWEPVNLSDLAGIRKALLVTLGVFKDSARLVTNLSGLFYLSTLKDNNGRDLVSPNPTDPSKMQVAAGPRVFPIAVFDDETLPNDGLKIPFILGDLNEAIQGFDRKQLTITPSDVATIGTFNAFANDMTIWRGIERNDIKQRDEEAIIYGYIESDAAVDSCRLSALALGSVSLSPAFDADTTQYTAATTAATNTITATAEDAGATVEIKNGTTAVTSGSAATWASGKNTVTIKVTCGTMVRTYTVVVTKS